MDIIMYLIQLIQQLYKQNCFLIKFICKYIPLRQWAYDNSHSPKYQKFAIDKLPKIVSHKQDWNWKDLINYYEQRYHKTIKPVFCKVCQSRFNPGIDTRFSKSYTLKCPNCDSALVHKKDRKHFVVHKCINKKSPYYLHNLKKVSKDDIESNKYKYKLHYIYREFQIDFFAMDSDSLPKNASSLKFSKHDQHTMSL